MNKMAVYDGDQKFFWIFISSQKDSVTTVRHDLLLLTRPPSEGDE